MNIKNSLKSNFFYLLTPLELIKTKLVKWNFNQLIQNCSLNSIIGFGTTVLRMFRKRKHFANEYAPGQRPVEGVAEFIGNVTMDAATELYYVLVNDRHHTPQPGILALRRNTTHNYGIVSGLAPEGKLLTNNFTL